MQPTTERSAMPHDVIKLLSEAGAAHPNDIALRQGDSAYSYSEMASNIATIAANLQSRGVQQGDRFLFSVPANPDGILLMLGIIASGGVVVLIAPDTTPELFESRYSLTTPKYAVAETAVYASSNLLLKSSMRKRVTTELNYGKLPVKHFYAGSWLPGTPLGAVSINKLLKKPKAELQHTDPTGEAIIAFTEGAKGDQKVVVHSQASLGSGMQAFVDLCQIDQDSIAYTDCFMFGIAAMTRGGQWEIPQTTITRGTEGWVDAMLEKGASHVFMGPEEADRMLNEIERCGDRGGEVGLKTLVIGAAPLVSSVVRRANELLPETKALTISGMTEVLPVVSVEGAGKIAYVNGDLASGVILGVTPSIDNLDGEDSAELILSGDGLMLGYLGDDQSAGSASKGRDGKHVATGIKTGMLVRANKNIYPGLYEPGIMQLSGISSCALVGVPDSRGDDIVVLVVVPAEKDQNERRLRRKVEAHLKHVMDVDALPDVVTVQGELPLSGRSSNVNRIQLRKDISSHPEVVTILKERARA